VVRKGENNMGNIRLMKYEQAYFDFAHQDNRRIVVYGIGVKGKYFGNVLEKVDMFCDKKAQKGMKLFGKDVIEPAELSRLGEKLSILICVKGKAFREEIKQELMTIDMDALIFDAFDNCSFGCYTLLPADSICTKKKKLEHVHIVNDDEGWILSKFADKLKTELEKKGIRAEISKYPDKTADINHFMLYWSYEPVTDINATFMITHVNSLNGINTIKHSLAVAKMGICMSKETMNQLVSYGVLRERICYVNPAQDGKIKPKKYILGITHRTYDHFDYRKRSTALLDICERINPDFFEFRIMGSGWDEIIRIMKTKGFSVVYYPEFDYDKYIELIPSLDYYLYWGFDEGSMGYLDALKAGIKTIVTPQGYHLDTRYGLTYPCSTIDEFVDVLKGLEREREKIIESVSGWTWEKYAEKHIEIWNYILGQEDGLYVNQHKYEDGINSVYRVDIKK